MGEDRGASAEHPLLTHTFGPIRPVVMPGMAGVYHKGIGTDHHHKGIGQSGNKSMLSFRNDIGVPGYTGYIPSSKGIILPIKGSTERSGFDGNDTKAEDLARETATLRDTMYKQHMKASPTSFCSDTRTGGGYWIQSARSSESSKPFVATSTYKAELQDGAEISRHVRDVSEHARPTICDQITAHRVGRAAQNHGELVDRLGYSTTYNTLTRTVKDSAPVPAGADAANAGVSSRGASRARVLPHLARPRFSGHSVYKDAHGEYGDNPLSRAAETARLQVKNASTKEFNLGTTRGGSNFHVPGYSGFIPASDEACACAAEALSASNVEQPRASIKDEMLLSDLDQYSRGSAPGYSGFRARAERNIVLANEKAPTKTTSQGETNFQAWRHGMPAVNKSKFNDGNRGCMSFFTGGSLSVSENGKSQAQRYYHSVRPNEGLPRVNYPSRTTAVGSPFPTY